MLIRRYLGKNTQEAMLKVKMDLGTDAVILNTRKIRQKGLLKIFSKPFVEVLAAVDEAYQKSKVNNKENKIKTNLPEKEEKITGLENKVNDIENLLKKVCDKINDDLCTKDNDAQKPKQKVVDIFYNNLIRNEVDQDIAKHIVELVEKRTLGSTSFNDIASVIYNIITGMLGKPEVLELREDGKPTVVIFVGPTGVGKTTTLAKIAANYALNHKKNVGLITTDTYRIAAVEQLKTYAEILGMPLNILYSSGEIKEAINKYSDKDIILIDTAGRSSRDSKHFEELKSLVDNAAPDNIYLVLSSTTSTKNCASIVKGYNFLKDYRLIFTKTDETSVLGIILNIKKITNKNLSYITTGQSVPDDIEVANIDKVAKNLLGSIN